MNLDKRLARHARHIRRTRRDQWAEVSLWALVLACTACLSGATAGVLLAVTAT